MIRERWRAVVTLTFVSELTWRTTTSQDIYYFDDEPTSAQMQEAITKSKRNQSTAYKIEAIKEQVWEI